MGQKVNPSFAGMEDLARNASRKIDCNNLLRIAEKMIAMITASRDLYIADAIAELCPLWLQHSASRDVCCPVEDKNHICTNLSFEKLDLIFLSRGVLWMREAALTAIHKRAFYGQKKLSIRPIHNFFVLITIFLRIRRLQNRNFIHKKASRD